MRTPSPRASGAVRSILKVAWAGLSAGMTLRHVRACPASMPEQPASALVSAAETASLLKALICRREGATGHGPTELGLEHGIGVCGRLGDRLHHVPMLHDLAVLQPEDVDDGHAALARGANGMHVQDHEIAIDQRALDLALGVGELLAPELDEFL